MKRPVNLRTNELFARLESQTGTLADKTEAARFIAAIWALEATKGNQSAAARVLRVDRNTLRSIIRAMLAQGYAVERWGKKGIGVRSEK